METVNPIDNIIVVKVGTSTLFCENEGRERLDDTSFARIGGQVIALSEHDYNCIIVSSGAVTAGLEAADLSQRPNGDEVMPEIQRLATIGWHRVMNKWDSALVGKKLAGELLLTKRELDLDAPEHDEALRTIYTLLSHGDVPIINENDAITHSELSHQSFEQNDTLAAVLAAQIMLSPLFSKNVKLVLLSDVDGVYEDVAKPDTLIHRIEDLDEYRHVAGESNSTCGKGGMLTKFDAIDIAHSAGVDVAIANGRAKYAIHKALLGKIGTFIPA